MFLLGEKIFLDTPQESDFEIWANWFNDPGITRYLHYGEIPNSIYDQKNFYIASLEKKNIVLMIRSKESKQLKGTISLSKINFRLKSADLALVSPIQLPEAPLASLEAIALIVSHAFENMGLEKVYADQNFPGLINWTIKMQTLGFQIEGFRRKSFLKHGVFENSVSISVSKEDFDSIKSFRGGNIWLGEKQMKSLLHEKTDVIKKSILDAYEQQAARENNLLANLLTPKVEK